MTTDKIGRIFKEEGIDNQITCPQAFAIAEKHKIQKSEISTYCNEHGIKIRACQLGCFK